MSCDELRIEKFRPYSVIIDMLVSKVDQIDHLEPLSMFKRVLWDLWLAVGCC